MLPIRAALRWQRQERVLDWFLADALKTSEGLQRRARSFVFAHLFGPPFGLLVIGYISEIDPSPGLHVAIIAAALVVFFGLPVALRFGASLTVLSLSTITWLAMIILFTAYHYGGMSSPFLSWLLAVPLMAVFFLGPGRSLFLFVFPMLLTGIGSLWLAGATLGFPEHIKLAALSGVGAISLACATAFVLVMALTYAEAVITHQNKLEEEMQKQREIEHELVGARDNAEAASRAKSVFLANMSHELRTPLNAIIGFSELIADGDQRTMTLARCQNYAADIRDSGRHLLGIINEILDLSKIEAGKAVLDDVREVRICRVVNSVLRTVEVLAERKGVRLQKELERGLPSVMGSERMLRQIALNLLSNAIKFTDAGGNVFVRTFGTPNDGLVHLVVSDTGKGMSTTQLDVALAPFEQVDQPLTRRHEGTGLGLSLARAMAELHGGTLTIRSAKGRGTTVDVNLPGVRSNDSDAASPESRQGPVPRPLAH